MYSILRKVEKQKQMVKYKHFWTSGQDGHFCFTGSKYLCGIAHIFPEKLLNKQYIL
jgi:hypothetical protein